MPYVGIVLSSPTKLHFEIEFDVLARNGGYVLHFSSLVAVYLFGTGIFLWHNGWLVMENIRCFVLLLI